MAKCLILLCSLVAVSFVVAGTSCGDGNCGGAEGNYHLLFGHNDGHGGHGGYKRSVQQDGNGGDGGNGGGVVGTGGDGGNGGNVHKRSAEGDVFGYGIDKCDRWRQPPCAVTTHDGYGENIYKRSAEGDGNGGNGGNGGGVVGHGGRGGDGGTVTRG